jgi:hypothetical protein
MSDQIKAIETVYNNYRFRSRLEAKWGVFFDALSIEYRYEPEGFELGDGIRYLPDFYLTQLKYWIEVKPDIPTTEEREKAIRLSVTTQKPVIILSGDAWDTVQGYGFVSCDDTFKDALKEGQFEEFKTYWLSQTECIGIDPLIGNYWGANFDRCYTWSRAYWCQCQKCMSVGIYAMIGITPHKDNMPCCDQHKYKFDTPDLRTAYTAARQARFEHGERP